MLYLQEDKVMYLKEDMVYHQGNKEVVQSEVMLAVVQNLAVFGQVDQSYGGHPALLGTVAPLFHSSEVDQSAHGRMSLRCWHSRTASSHSF